MEAIIARIKEYVLRINSDLSGDLLDFVIEDVAYKACGYMNRTQFIKQYAEDRADYPITDESDTSETYYEYWKDYDEKPIPQDVERTLAGVVIGAYKMITDKVSSDIGVVTSVTDNGQSVSFKNEMANFLSSSNEAEVFSGSLTLLDRHKVGEVLGDTSYFDNRRTL